MDARSLFSLMKWQCLEEIEMEAPTAENSRSIKMDQQTLQITKVPSLKWKIN